eukprot:scaffold6795_cov110-Cylindrotheca_fusiformis.AAC.4
MSEAPERDVTGENTPPVSVDRTLAAALEKLSLEEREKVYEDVHGVTDEIQETAEFVSNSLEQMDREIGLINEKDAYEQAKLQSYNLVTNHQFRLSFLRYTLFNPKMAALHLVQYFNIKQELFGTENVAKSRIAHEDLDEATTRMLKLGSLQVLPCRDSKGRAVVAFARSVLESAVAAYDDLLPTMMKAFWYLMSTLCEDEETQKKGVVVVANVLGLSDGHEKCHRRLPSLLLSELASAARPITQVRIRTHNGELTDCLNRLMSFGIPVQELPFGDDGVVLLANHFKWLERRRKKEAYLSANPSIEGAVDLPSNHDVLWGKGKHIVGHPGNRLLHELVEAYSDQYNQLSKSGKTKLADKIISAVHGYSGRFLKLDNESGMWVEVSNLEAKEKVTHRFRRNRAIFLEGGSTHSKEPTVALTTKETDDGSKLSRMMFSGS